MELKDIFNSVYDVSESKKHHKQKHHHEKGQMVKNSHTGSVGMVLSPFYRGYWPIAVLGGGHEHWRDDRCEPHTPSHTDVPAATNPTPAPPAPAGLGPANGQSGSTGNSPSTSSGGDSGGAGGDAGGGGGGDAGGGGGVSEGRQMKNHMDEVEYSTWDSWRKACRAAYTDVTFQGDKDIAQAMHADGKHSIGEWDGAVGIVYKKPAGMTEDMKLNESAGEDMRLRAMKLKRDGNMQSYHYQMMKYHEHMEDAEDGNLHRHGRLSSSGKLALKNIEKHKAGYAEHKAALDALKKTPVKEAKAMFPSSKPAFWIVDRDGEAGPYKTKEAAIKDGAKERNVKFGIINNDGDFKKMSEPVKEAFGIKIDGELWMKGDKPVSFASSDDANNAILKSPSMSPKNAKVVPLQENDAMQSLGKGLKSTVGTKPTVTVDATADTGDDVKTDVNTTPADKDDADAGTEVEANSQFKVGDKVTPNVGPHKGQVHSVIHVFPDGRVNIKPDSLETSQVKYRLGAVTAQPDQLTLSESFKIARNILMKGGSLLTMFTKLDESKVKSLDDLRAELKKVLDKMDSIVQAGGRIMMNDPLMKQKAQIKKDMAALKLKEEQLKEARSNDDFMPMGYGPKKGHTIEAYGRKGMKNSKWRKMFKSSKELEKWCEDNDATVEGQRDLDDNEKR